MKKRIISILLVFLTAISCIYQNASAYDLDETKESILDSYYNEEIPTDRIISALSSIERSKEAWGLADIDFENIYIGSPVYTYVYSDGSFTENSKIYPISNDDQLILLAVDSDGMITITTELVSTLNNLVGFDDLFAIIYDSYGCYICTHDSRIQLAEYDIDDESVIPSILPEDNKELLDEITYTQLMERYSVTYEIPCDQYAFYYIHSCKVSAVDQLPDENICWAACVACIVNYKKGYDLTAQEVAKKYYGSNNYNEGLNTKYIPDLMHSYGLNSPKDLIFPTDAKIYNELRLGYPIYARFVADKKGLPNHACVIWGIDTSRTVKNITIMDPWGGVNYYVEFDGIEYYRYHCVGLNRDYHLGAILVHAEEE